MDFLVSFFLRTLIKNKEKINKKIIIAFTFNLYYYLSSVNSKTDER